MVALRLWTYSLLSGKGKLSDLFILNYILTKLEPEGPRAEVGLPTADQGFLSIQGTLFGFYKMVFYAFNICPHQAWTNANDKKTVKDYLKKHIMRRLGPTEKYSNINWAEWWIPFAKWCRISIVRYMICYYRDTVVDLKQEVPDLRSGGIPRPI